MAADSTDQQDDVAFVLGEPRVRAFLAAHVHTFVFNAVPADYPDPEDLRHYFDVRVDWRGKNMYAVINNRNEVLSKDGAWDWEPQPSSRTKKFLRAHRFALEEAIHHAQAAAPKITLMGKSIAQIMENDPTQP